MNLLVLQKKESIAQNQFLLTERKSSHILEILKKTIGDELVAGLWNDSLGKFTITKITQEHKIEGIYTKLSEPVIPNKKIFVVSSLQRPQTIKKILQFTACAGIHSVYFFISNKSEKSYLNSPIWKEESIEDEILLGLEQGKRIVPPNVRLFERKRELLEVIRDGCKIIFHPNEKRLHHYQKDIMEHSDIYLLIGPESGFTPEDVHYFTQHGFSSSGLSDSILRSEHALIYSISQIEYISLQLY